MVCFTGIYSKCVKIL